MRFLSARRSSGQDVGAAQSGLGRRLVGEDGAAARGTPVHEHDVHRDAVQPGAELRLAAEVFQALVDLDKDFLDDVIEVAASPEHAAHQARHVGPVALVKSPERGCVAGGRPRDEALLVGHSRPYLSHRTVATQNSRERAYERRARDGIHGSR